MARSNTIDFSAWAFWYFAISVILLPVGLGGDRPIPFGLCQLGLALTCLFLVLSDHSIPYARFFERVRWALGLIVLVVLWALFQVLPVVPDVWKHPLWKEAAAALSVPVHGTIAVSPEDSLRGLVRLVTYFGAGILAYFLGQDPKRAHQMLKLFWYSGVVICLYGLFLTAIRSETILWFKKWAYQDDLTATFVNHNHFALYAGMVLVSGLSLFIRSYINDVRRAKQHQRLSALRHWLTHTGPVQLLLLVLVFLSIVLSHSRAGLVLAVGGLFAYIFFYQLYMRAWLRASLIAGGALVAFVLLFALAFSYSDHFAELFSDYSSLDRMQVYGLGWHVLQDNTWLGYGLNGFEPEFRLYQQNMTMEFNHAHSDVLESLIDLGVPAGLMLWSAIALLLTGLLHGVMNRRQNGIYPCLALSVSLMVLAHACVDFSMQIPGVVIPWAALLGIGLAQSWGESEKNTVL